MTEVIAPLGFTEPLPVRLKFHANDRSGDVLNTVPREARIQDARTRSSPPTLDVEGFTLVPHKSEVQDFRNSEEVERVYTEEVHRLLLELTGADRVEIRGAAVLRFGERSQDSGAHDNSRPGRFVHIDASDAAAKSFNSQIEAPEGRRLKRAVQYNVWRSITQPPQDVPLAVCEAGSVDPKDFVFADALFDRNGEILGSFESVLLKYNPKQRWAFFANMRPDEALIFKTHDTETGVARQVPHGAFDNPLCPPDTTPRASIEIRGTASWYE